MAWKFDHKKLALDLAASVGIGFADHVRLGNGDLIIISQLLSGDRTLRVREFLETVERPGEEPATCRVECE